jgi:hypothetical protein
MVTAIARVVPEDDKDAGVGEDGGNGTGRMAELALDDVAEDTD